MGADYTSLPADPPAPIDDGAADGLVGSEVPDLALPSTSGADLRLAAALGLPTFEVEGRSFYRRLTFVAAEGRIVKVFYPVFPPDRDAGGVLAWLGGRAAEAEFRPDAKAAG